MVANIPFSDVIVIATGDTDAAYEAYANAGGNLVSDVLTVATGGAGYATRIAKAGLKTGLSTGAKVLAKEGAEAAIKAAGKASMRLVRKKLSKAAIKKYAKKYAKWLKRNSPIVGIVVTISPSFSLYKIVVFPAASRPT